MLDHRHIRRLAQLQPGVGAGVGHGGVWRYLCMHQHTEGVFYKDPLNKSTIIHISPTHSRKVFKAL